MPPTRRQYRYREEPSDTIQEELDNEQSDTGAESSSVQPQITIVAVLLTGLVTLALILI